MANTDDQMPNLNDLDLPGDELPPAEPQVEQTLQPPSELPEEQAPIEQLEQTGEPTEAEVGLTPSKTAVYVEWGAAIGVPIFLLAIAAFGLINFSTAIYLIAIGFIPYGLWKYRETNTIYTVILGCALAAILTAIYCLWVEMGRYEFDVKARDANPRLSAVSCQNEQPV